MNVALQLPVDEDKLGEFCRKWRISELAVFGSVLRDDFGPESDVDFLVSFAPESKWRLFDKFHMQDELSEIVGRPVDLVDRSALQEARNPFRRRAILNSAQVLNVG